MGNKQSNGPASCPPKNMTLHHSLSQQLQQLFGIEHSCQEDFKHLTPIYDFIYKSYT